MEIPANIIIMKMMVQVDECSIMEQKVRYTIFLSSSNLKEDECKRVYALSGTFVCQKKVENRPKKRSPLKAPEKL